MEIKEKAPHNTEASITELLSEKGFDFEIASSYGEPGYKSEKPIILANWSDLGDELTQSVESMFEIQYEDEWTVLYDEDCKAYRTSPDSYGWKPSIVLWKGEFVSWQWLKDNDELLEYIQGELCNNPRAACNCPIKDIDVDLNEIAEKVNENQYQSGLHEGMNDNPSEILNSFDDKARSKLFFRVNCVSQFSADFELWKLK